MSETQTRTYRRSLCGVVREGTRSDRLAGLVNRGTVLGKLGKLYSSAQHITNYALFGSIMDFTSQAHTVELCSHAVSALFLLATGSSDLSQPCYVAVLSHRRPNEYVRFLIGNPGVLHCLNGLSDRPVRV